MDLGPVQHEASHASGPSAGSLAAKSVSLLSTAAASAFFPVPGSRNESRPLRQAVVVKAKFTPSLSRLAEDLSHAGEDMSRAAAEAFLGVFPRGSKAKADRLKFEYSDVHGHHLRVSKKDHAALNSASGAGGAASLPTSSAALGRTNDMVATASKRSPLEISTGMVMAMLAFSSFRPNR